MPNKSSNISLQKAKKAKKDVIDIKVPNKNEEIKFGGRKLTNFIEGHHGKEAQHQHKRSYRAGLSHRR